MPSEGFVPPDTGRTEDLRADVLNLASLWADAYAHKTDEKARWIKMADALDTLVQYHRAAGAVEALEAAKHRRGGTWSALDAEIAAAQERLAAYAKEAQ